MAKRRRQRPAPSARTPSSGSCDELNGGLLCPECATNARAAFEGGTRAGRAIKAIVAGAVAALLGAILYYAVAALTGYEFGLIAIVVGFAVGAAVRWGSNGRGGWVYQTLAIALTYLAIVATYVPAVFEAFQNPDTQVSDSATPGSEANQPAADTAAQPVSLTETSDQPPSAGEFVAGILIIGLLVCVAPFLAGFENIMGLIIIGIGLYEAWKLNRRTPFEMTGPHQVQAVARSA